MYRTPRLIRCQLPSKEDQTSALRVIPAGRLTSIITHHSTMLAPLVLDMAAHGVRKQSNENLPPAVAQRLAHLPHGRAVNMNCDLRPFARLQLEVLWGDIPPLSLRKLHDFAACYAVGAKLQAQKSIFLIETTQVAHFHRLFERLCATRHWLRPRLSGPWPPISFGEE